MIKTELFNPFDSAPVFYKRETGSTMQDIRGLPEGSHGSVVFTGFQKAGRGRIPGRTWFSQKEQNLLMTLRLETAKIPAPVFRVPLLTGLGVAEFLKQHFQLEGAIKWPNDVLVEGKKICGILCESSRDKVFVGIGLNCGQVRFDPAVRQKSTSIALLSDNDSRPERLLPLLLQNLKDAYADPSWRDKILSRLYGLGRVVSLKEGAAEEGGEASAKITDLSEEGFLIVKNLETGETKTLLAGEILFPGYHGI